MTEQDVKRAAVILAKLKARREKSPSDYHVTEKQIVKVMTEPPYSWDFSGATLREYVHHLIVTHQNIGSCSDGYFYVMTLEDREKSLAWVKGRSLRLLERVRAEEQMVANLRKTVDSLFQEPVVKELMNPDMFDAKPIV